MKISASMVAIPQCGGNAFTGIATPPSSNYGTAKIRMNIRTYPHFRREIGNRPCPLNSNPRSRELYSTPTICG
jgi:hypothetical protein